MERVLERVATGRMNTEMLTLLLAIRDYMRCVDSVGVQRW